MIENLQKNIVTFLVFYVIENARWFNIKLTTTEHFWSYKPSLKEGRYVLAYLQRLTSCGLDDNGLSSQLNFGVPRPLLSLLNPAHAKILSNKLEYYSPVNSMTRVYNTHWTFIHLFHKPLKIKLLNTIHLSADAYRCQTQAFQNL